VRHSWNLRKTRRRHNNATTGAEAHANFRALRGAEAPLFHGITGIRGITGFVVFTGLRGITGFVVFMGIRGFTHS
ncbi:MAG: hypothetical protein WA604_18620, partial [Candidatus Sulfotelmatobacter sp.]